VRTVAKINYGSGRDHGLHYDAVFLDVDHTLLWADLDIEGYVEDLSPYTTNGLLTVERATGPVWEGMRRHIKENIKHRTEDDLADFKRRNVERTARELGIVAPSEILIEVAERRTSLVPYPESEAVLRRLREMGLKPYVVSNWDVLLVEVLKDLGWMRYFDGVIASGVVGVEKPDPRIFEEALRVSGVGRERAIHVGNDPISDIRGAAGVGIDTVLVDRRGTSRRRRPHTPSLIWAVCRVCWRVEGFCLRRFPASMRWTGLASSVRCARSSSPPAKGPNAKGFWAPPNAAPTPARACLPGSARTRPATWRSVSWKPCWRRRGVTAQRCTFPE
jgi:putative hydrolase of the HAD superfamily